MSHLICAGQLPEELVQGLLQLLVLMMAVDPGAMEEGGATEEMMDAEVCPARDRARQWGA